MVATKSTENNMEKEKSQVLGWHFSWFALRKRILSDKQ